MFSLTRRSLGVALSAVAASGVVGLPRRSAADSAPALPSWNDGPAKQAILDFVKRRPPTGGPDFVPPEDRIATFDQDGTLWVEHPVYAQAMFALDRVHVAGAASTRSGSRRSRSRRCSPATWRRSRKLHREGLDRDRRRHPRRHEQRGRSRRSSKNWLADGQAPPLRAALHRARLPADAGGDGPPARQRVPHLHRHRRRPGVRARRTPRRVYGVPPEQVVGSSIATKYELKDGKPELMRLAEGVLRSTTATARPSASTCSSASARTPRSATPTATARCWSGPAPATARG